MQCTADGPGSDRVPKLAAAGLRAELVITLHLQIGARIVSAVQATRVTSEFVQVRVVCVYEFRCVITCIVIRISAVPRANEMVFVD